MSIKQAAELALAAALAVAFLALWLRRNPTVPCPHCEGVGWTPKAGQGDWSRGGKGCRRCDRYGTVTVSVVWVARVLTGKRGQHPRARMERLPMPDRRGRQEVDAL